jgi:hypothetical protein
MKTLLLALSLAAPGVSTATAQIYQPNVVNGSILGGIAGAIIGGHNHDRWGEGALIGAAAGALIGAATEPPRATVYQQVPVTVVQTVPTAQVVPQAPVVGQAPVVAAPGTSAPQVVYVQQAPPTQVVYVPYYANAPVYYSAPAVSVGFGYSWGPRRAIYVGRGHGRW